MKKQLHELAYLSAVTHFKAATLSTFRELSDANPETDFDTLHQASIRAFDLHISSLALGESIWAKRISFESAEKSLIAKFHEFPHEVVSMALGTAYTSTR